MPGAIFLLIGLLIGAYYAPISFFQGSTAPAAVHYDGQTAKALARKVYRAHNAAILHARASGAAGAFTPVYATALRTEGLNHCSDAARVMTGLVWDDLAPLAEAALDLSAMDLGAVGYRTGGTDHGGAALPAGCAPPGPALFIVTRI